MTLDSLLNQISKLLPGEELVLGTLAEQHNLAPQVISALLLDAEDKGLLICYNPDTPACHWVINQPVHLAAWAQPWHPSAKVAKVTKKERILSYLSRKETVMVEDVVALGHKRETVRAYFRLWKKENEIEYIGGGVYRCRLSKQGRGGK